jgi:hypothetical protein
MISKEFKNEILFHKKVKSTVKATQFCLKSQTIRDMRVKGWSEIWIPNSAFELKEGSLLVKDWFWNGLVFV